LFLLVCKAQTQKEIALKSLADQGEVMLSVQFDSQEQLQSIKNIISVEIISGNSATIYISSQKFEQLLQLGLNFYVMQPKGMEYQILSSRKKRDLGDWNFYPTYQQYVSMMEGFQANYPNLCKLVEFGTSVKNRKLLCLKISDQVAEDESEPEFLYLATIHGNETGGYNLMLHLIDSLLTAYGTDPEITQVVDSLEIWICPLFNPDGTYAGGDNVIGTSVSKRFNSNNYDLNRNFPDPVEGNYPNGSWQKETIALMSFLKEHNFSLAANLHGGVEVINYPWDVWHPLYPDNRPHADMDWYKAISRAYADTVHKYAVPGYMTYLDNGITNGADWYVVSGGLQDYSNYYLHSRHLTIELSNNHLPYTNELTNLWKYNYHSLMGYMKQSFYGIKGFVTNAQDTEPIKAKIRILNHDKDSSEIYSNSSDGFYFRLIEPGTYTLICSAFGFYNDTIENVVLGNQDQIQVNFELEVDPFAIDTNDISSKGYSFHPNPATEYLELILALPCNEPILLTIFNSCGKAMFQRTLDTNQNKIQEKYVSISTLQAGSYICKLESNCFNKSFTFVKM